MRGLFRLAESCGKLACACLVMILEPDEAWAAQQFVVRTWQTEDGLPQHSGTAVTQTADGYLWVGTFNGLARFNGVEFTRFTVGNTKEIPNDDINVLYEDRSGRLWIGTSAGLVCYDQGQFTHWSSPEKLRRASVRSLVERPDGTVFVATDRGVWKIAAEQTMELTIPGAQWPTSRSHVVCDRAGVVWVAHAQRLFRLNEDGLQPQVRFDAPISALTIGSDGTFWCGFEEKVMLWKPGGSPGQAAFDVRFVRALRETRDGDWWIATSGNGLHHWHHGKIAEVPTVRGVRNMTIYGFAEDREGNLWAGAGRGGISRLNPAIFETFNPAAGSIDLDVISIVEDHAGRLWLGTFDGGLWVGEKADWQRFTSSGLLATNANVLTLCQTRDHTLWIGRQDLPLRRVRNGLMEVESRSQVNGARVLYEDSKGRLWVGTRYEGVECLQADRTDRWSMTNGLSDNLITAITQDATGAIWIGTGNGLNRLVSRRGPNEPRESTVQSSKSGILLPTGTTTPTNEPTIAGRPEVNVERFFVQDGLGLDRIHSLLVDSDGTLWIGTAGGGLTRYRDGRFVTVTSRQGLQSDVVAQILEDGAGSLWIASTAGIFQMDKRVLHDVLDGRERFVRCLAYGKKDGMRIAGYPGGFQPTCVRTRDGRLWFCTNGGVTVVDPQSIHHTSLPPPVHVEKLLVDGVEVRRDRQDARALASAMPTGWEGKSQTSNLKFEMPPGATRLEFHCAALSFTAPEQIQYKFWLEGYEKAWRDVGARRVAYYTGLAPGRYRFHVKAATADGVWNENAAQLAFSIRPFVWQSLWFRIAVALASLCGVGAIILTRVHRLKRMHALQTAFSRRLLESQEAERKRIASELHDGLGQSLMILKNRAELARQGAAHPALLEEQLREITAGATRAIEEIRATVRALRPAELDRLGFTLAVEAMVEQVQAATGLEFLTDLDPIDSSIPRTTQVGLYRILQEAINNTVRHARAKTVVLEVKKSAAGIRIRCQDNGCGFDPARRPHSEGLGLAGICERATMIGAKVHLQTAPGRGVCLLLEVPIKSAPHEA